MDPAAGLLCMLLGGVLTVTALYLVLRRGMHQVAEASTYRAVSERLGLVVDTRGVSVHGYVNRRRVWVGRVMEGFGPDRRTEVRGVVALRRPLGLGLLVRPKGLTGRLSRKTGPEQGAGIAAIDRLAHVHDAERDQLRQLLDDRVRECLLAALGRWPRLSVTDVDVQVRLRRPPHNPEGLEALVRAMVEIADAVEAARASVRPAAEPGSWVQGWRELGDELGLTLEDALPALCGQVDGRDVQVGAARSPDGYRVQVICWFADHAAMGLHLRPQVDPDGYWSVGQDIQIGHEGVDRAFVIKAYDPDLLRSRLNHLACEGLMALAALGKVEVDDRRVVVDDLDGTDVDALRAAVRGARGLATHLGW